MIPVLCHARAATPGRDLRYYDRSFVEATPAMFLGSSIIVKIPCSGHNELGGLASTAPVVQIDSGCLPAEL